MANRLLTASEFDAEVGEMIAWFFAFYEVLGPELMDDEGD